MEIEVHFPLDYNEEEEKTMYYPEKAVNMMNSVAQRLGEGKNKKYFFVFRQKGAPFQIRILLESDEPLGQIYNTLSDITYRYKIEFFQRV